MSPLQDFVLSAQKRALNYAQCSPEQASVYACEDIVDEHIGSPIIESIHAHTWLENVCEREDIDLPHVHIHQSRQHFRASSLQDNNTIHLYGDTTHISTLLHEVAHLMSDGHSHGALFRDEMIRLSRAHISVEYAAMLHGLYSECGLSVSPWTASTRRR